MVGLSTSRPRVAQPVLPIVTVPRVCPNGLVVCIASGPSLTEDDAQFCQGKATVIAVNDGYRYAPFATAVMASDAEWWRVNRGLPAFAGLKYCLEPAAVGRWPGVDVLRKTGHDGLELDPTGLKTGRNSGAAAINVAVHFGASRVLLLGYDMQAHPTKGEHFFGAHRAPLRTRSPYEVFRRTMATMVGPLRSAGVTVLNCSRETALDCFPRQPLREALA